MASGFLLGGKKKEIKRKGVTLPNIFFKESPPCICIGIFIHTNTQDAQMPLLLPLFPTLLFTYQEDNPKVMIIKVAVVSPCTASVFNSSYLNVLNRSCPSR